MHRRQILTPADCDKIIAHLDECLVFFEKKPGLLNGNELRAKSLLTVMKNEFLRHSSSDTLVPFDVADD